MHAEIYCFSGTGNSLHAAHELMKRLPNATLIPIVRLLNEERIVSNGTKVGLVFPLHGLTAPVAVRRLLKKADLGSASYLFALAARGGSVCRAFDYIEARLRKQPKHLDAWFVLDMPNNDPKLAAFEPVTDEKLAETEARLQLRLEKIAQVVAEEKGHRPQNLGGVSFSLGFALTQLMERLVIWGVGHVDALASATISTLMSDVSVVAPASASACRPRSPWRERRPAGSLIHGA
jgi:hypothetical protein